jgi:hypothetical protein
VVDSHCINVGITGEHLFFDPADQMVCDAGDALHTGDDALHVLYTDSSIGASVSFKDVPFQSTFCE